MARLSFSPKLYDFLSSLTRSKNQVIFQDLVGLLQPQPGEVVVEVGCGTGIMARYFIDRGFQYWGFDIDSRRVEFARRRLPKAHLAVGDAINLNKIDLPPARCFFACGVLHHLDDDACRCTINRVLATNPNIVFALIEPYYPSKWYEKLLATPVKRLDEGKYIRTLKEWRTVLGENLAEVTTRNLLPIWPTPMILGRLTERQTLG